MLNKLKCLFRFSLGFPSWHVGLHLRFAGDDTFKSIVVFPGACSQDWNGYGCWSSSRRFQDSVKGS
jgi:hypothetical protein